MIDYSCSIVLIYRWMTENLKENEWLFYVGGLAGLGLVHFSQQINTKILLLIIFML